MIKSMILFGTRPEAIKMAPVVKTLQADARFDVRLAVTAQHREMLDQVLKTFGLVPDYDFDIMRPKQTLTAVTTKVLEALTPVLERERPDVLLVHGDTLTTFVGALSAFFCQIPVAHVEAGLRSFERYDPFPEEMNRRIAGVLSTLHFAPTQAAKKNLLTENVEEEAIFVTGNTVIDALRSALKTTYTFADPTIAEAVRSGRRILLVTTHRRENLGEPMRRVYEAVLRLVSTYPDVEAIFPVHLNPAVRETATAMLGGRARVHLIDPPDYLEFIHLLQASTLVLTDSGGLQEEAPALGKPVLVLRATTERPEGMEAGVSVAVGTDPDQIVSHASRLLDDEQAYARMAKAVNPYGDGEAAARIRDALLHWRGLAPRPADFTP